MLALPALLCGSECWTVKDKTKSRRVAAEMQFMRKKGYDWTDYKIKTELLRELKVSLGDLGVTCSPRDPRFAGSNTAEVDGFFRT